MPRFGICGALDHAPSVKAAGFDYVEGATVPLFDGRIEEDAELDLQRVQRCPLPVPCCNMLVPGEITITGDDRDVELLAEYMDRTLCRAGKAGVAKLVFGSGRSRGVADGQSRDAARDRIVEFLKVAALFAGRYGVTLVIEPLRSAECNIINGVGEAMDYVRAVDHPHVQCLVDSYHLWEEDEPLADLEAAMPSIRHVHVADRGSRAGSGLSANADNGVAREYRDFFAVLKAGGYDGDVSVEGKHDWDAATLTQIHDFLHEQWNAA